MTKTVCIMKKMALIATGLMLAATGAFALAASQTGASVKLPDKAQQFIRKYFPKARIIHLEAEKDFLEELTYSVDLSNGFELDFDSKGQWLEVDGDHSALPEGIVPEKTVSFVKRKHAGEKIVRIERTRKGYEAELSDDRELRFKPDGTFIGYDD